MSDFVEKLRLKGMAEEDVYFAQRDRDLIEAMKHKRLANELTDCGGSDDTAAQAAAFEQEFETLTRAQQDQPSRLLRSYRALIAQIKARCRQRH
jgi:hypothetical protein